MRVSPNALATASLLALSLVLASAPACAAAADSSAAASTSAASPTAATGAPAASAQPQDAKARTASEAGAARMYIRPPVPLLIDPTDLGLGATVVFDHIPDAHDLGNLSYLSSVQHVVLTLPAWPEDFSKIEPMQLSLFPVGADLIVVLPGYPRTHAAIAAWNLVHRPLRMVVVVPGPPSDRSMITELNALRGLERVVCDTQEPSRSGFERLQKPLSFRVFRP